MKSFGQRATGVRLERMRASPLWRDGGFRNLHPIEAGLRDPSVPMPSVKDFLWGGERRTPEVPLPSFDPREAWSRNAISGLRATWLGHSTVLLEMDGCRVLTDPVWGTRASPFRLLGPKRFQPVPLRLRDVPDVDVVVISHDHYDHLDYPTIRALAGQSRVPFVTSLGVGAHLQAWGVAPERITELDWWESHRVPGTGLTVTAAPSQHFSGRGLKDRNATLWSSMVMRTDRHSVFFSGDTGLTAEYALIRERLGPFDLVMLEVGAFHPAWGDIHLGPLNALKAHQLLGGGAFLPVHWGTFSLAMHAWDEPANTLLANAPSRDALVMPRLGEAVEPKEQRSAKAWWRQGGSEEAHPAEVEKPKEPTQTMAVQERDLPWPLD
ncbi:MBL fold metallo-hydrolase [Hydrogenophaga sp. PAMC20947]|uniref:MBL fold metallo-hydrolase n=1 Tax=Hydrogenophaga sp. PAMC20947 TaxID=2565558 RepID=UPI00109DDEB2|nr:MBL fold metallo-hydrolase [Hydrogenophaga sp. PAMC20947]QCB48128.1 MBL fold metallo-hydrolase [Hydrogenophaga sp. PAMC20947]